MDLPNAVPRPQQKYLVALYERYQRQDATESPVSAGMLNTGAGKDREATHVCFINDRIRPGMPGRTVLMPLKMLLPE